MNRFFPRHSFRAETRPLFHKEPRPTPCGKRSNAGYSTRVVGRASRRGRVIPVCFTLTWLLFCASVHASYKTDLYVAQDGSGDFKSIQSAIDGAKAFPDQRITIHIKNGVYEEKVTVPDWNNRLTLKGESSEGVIIRWGDYFDKMKRGRNSTFYTATLLVLGDEFHAENLTVENTAGPVGQAIALAVEADRCEFDYCRMIGNQDTLYADGANARQYYKHCYIEGTTDFIFGGATALFEDCTIQSKANSYITAASTPQGQPYGFVFLKCRLTAAPDVTKVYLGRPWRSYAKTVFVHCGMGACIRPEGWNNWNSPEKEKTVFYAEGGNTGPGADTSKRVPWAKILSDEKISGYSKAAVLKSFTLPEMVNNNIPRDTSYTLQSAYAKCRKYYPSIEPVQYNTMSGTLRQADVCYHTVDGRPLSLDVFATDGKAKAPRPAIILIHGGGWSSGDRSLMYPLADCLARHGFVAFTVEYRLSPEAKYPAAVEDLKNAVSWVVQNGGTYGVDTNKVAVLGCSAGAQLACLIGLTTKPIGAIVNIDGVMDFTCKEALKHEDDPSRKTTAASRWFGGHYVEKPKLWKEASPVYYVSKNSPPILFINSSQPRFHAGRDEVIKKLNQYSIYSEVHTFNDARHCFWLFEPWFKQTGTFIVQFLNKTLK